MNESPPNSSRWPVGFGLAIAALILGFSVPLYRLGRFALRSDLYSYILVVPLISLGLVWLKRAALPPPSAPDRKLAALLLAAGIAPAAAFGLTMTSIPSGPPETSLFLTGLSFAILFAGVCGWFVGRRTFRAIVFPLAFLVLIAPFPRFVSDLLAAFFQHTSAAVAYGFFGMAGMPVLQRGNLDFQLPGMSLEVARQCSGLHSSLALLIVSLPAGYLLLRSPWRRAALTLAAVPIGILRNGFRIFTIGELCVRKGPQMIDSYIHRTGGWMFFLLFLAPFLVLLFLLAHSERPAVTTTAKPLGA